MDKKHILTILLASSMMVLAGCQSMPSSFGGGSSVNTFKAAYSWDWARGNIDNACMSGAAAYTYGDRCIKSNAFQDGQVMTIKDGGSNRLTHVSGKKFEDCAVTIHQVTNDGQIYISYSYLEVDPQAKGGNFNKARTFAAGSKLRSYEYITKDGKKTTGKAKSEYERHIDHEMKSGDPTRIQTAQSKLRDYERHRGSTQTEGIIQEVMQPGDMIHINDGPYITYLGEGKFKVNTNNPLPSQAAKL